MKELIEKIDFYYSEDGLCVFTEKYHLERGHCCGMRCLHCPYNYMNVPETQTSPALLNRSEEG